MLKQATFLSIMPIVRLSKTAESTQVKANSANNSPPAQTLLIPCLNSPYGGEHEAG